MFISKYTNLPLQCTPNGTVRCDGDWAAWRVLGSQGQDQGIPTDRTVYLSAGGHDNTRPQNLQCYKHDGDIRGGRPSLDQWEGVRLKAVGPVGSSAGNEEYLIKSVRNGNNLRCMLTGCVDFKDKSDQLWARWSIVMKGERVQFVSKHAHMMLQCTSKGVVKGDGMISSQWEGSSTAGNNHNNPHNPSLAINSDPNNPNLMILDDSKTNRDNPNNSNLSTSRSRLQTATGNPYNPSGQHLSLVISLLFYEYFSFNKYFILYDKNLSDFQTVSVFYIYLYLLFK